MKRLALLILALVLIVGCTPKEQPIVQITPEPQVVQQGQPQTTSQAQGVTLKKFTIEADDKGFYPEEITVDKGDAVTIVFQVKTTDVYYGGLRFVGPWGDSGKVLPGKEISEEFTASSSFSFTSWWPLKNVQKATGTVNVN